MTCHHPGFLPIPGAPGYSFEPATRQVISCVRGKCGYPIAIYETGKPDCRYLAFHVSIAKKKTQLYVHDVAAHFYLGPKPAGLHVRHRNGDNLDNSPDNLLYGSRSQNMMDSVKHGTHFNASKIKCVNGHDFTPENTINNHGGRGCRTCKNDSARRAYARRHLK